MKFKKNNLKRGIISNLSSVGYMPRWIVLAVDLVLCTLAFYLAYFLVLKLYYNIPQYQEVAVETRLLVTLFCQTVFFFVFQTFAGILRYSTYADALKLAMSVLATLIVLFIIHYAWYFLFGVRFFLGVGLLVYGVLAFLFLFLLRLIVKVTFDYFVVSVGQVIPVLIYGAKTAGVSIGKMLHSTTESKYKLIGFIDDSKSANKMQILGCPVYLRSDERKLKEVFKKKQIRAVIFSPWKMKDIKSTKELDFFLNNQVSVLTAPLIESYEDRLDEDKLKKSLKKIKSIQIEDLLNRRQITINQDNIAKQITGKVVLISGAAGSIGSEIARQITSFNPKMLVLVDQAESPLHNLRLEMEEKFPDLCFTVFIGDVRNYERMEALMQTYRPDIVYHAAAYKHVPLMEDNPSESILTNVLGTKNMADLSVKYNVSSFVMVSTDKAVNPTNVMGGAKRIAEIYVQSLFNKLVKENSACTQFITTRFGNVLGSNGSVIPLFRQQIEKGGPLTVTHPDIIRYFMTIPEACLLVLEAGSMGKGGEILIFDMGEPVKIVDLARRMIQLAGFVPDVDIAIKFTGLRPGEKLYEELLLSKENTIPTYHDKIMIAKVCKFDYDTVLPEIMELISLAHDIKDYAVVEKMKKIVPEYISKNSPYEVIDSKNKIYAKIN
ncbi:MAG: nucleoside-diphosphate sugar epimerase/dehydratase [Paludibacteraceae bacterium]